jgi:hypothetical protein
VSIPEYVSRSCRSIDESNSNFVTEYEYGGRFVNHFDTSIMRSFYLLANVLKQREERDMVRSHT